LELLLSLQDGEATPSVAALDEDGNGRIGFSEFAQWAGPRLGLPLGVVLSRGATSSIAEERETCGIKGCPCTNFTLDDRPSKVGKWNQIFGSGQVMAPNNCMCGHKKSAHVPTTIMGESSSQFPTYWKNRVAGECNSNFQEFVPVGSEVLAGLQSLLDKTYSTKWTRDRRKHQANPNVPKGFKVQSAMRNEHKKQWYPISGKSLI
jgi:hypothetical protein